MNIEDKPPILSCSNLCFYLSLLRCRNPIFSCEQTLFLNRLVIIWCQTRVMWSCPHD